jgi:hypothetical protein
MEHLAIPKDAIIPPIEVPYVSKADYDYPAPFGGFRQRHLHELDSKFGDLEQGDIELSLIQTWLYFGVISEFFQRPIVPSDFVSTTSAGSRVVNSRPLLDLSREWKKSMSVKKGEALLQAVDTTVALLAEAVVRCEEFERIRSDEVSRILVFSVKVLICFLNNCVRKFKTTQSVFALSERLRQQFSTTLNWEDEAFPLWKHMIENGWCGHQIRTLAKKCSIPTLYYLACLSRPSNGEGHSECPKHPKCIKNGIDKEFRTHHALPDCNCDNAPVVNPAKVMDILATGKIPLVSCTWDADGEPSLFVTEARPGSIYTAISHVWADGLGNLKSNDLPRCQLKRLLDSLEMLNQHIEAQKAVGLLGKAWWILSPARIFPRRWRKRHLSFWMDVYCVPISGDDQSTRQYQLKKTAIRLMTPTFLGASNVLVLDSELQQVQFSRESYCPEDYAPLTARIMSSTWMTRSWLFQEAVLARKLYVKLLDCFVKPKEATQGCKTEQGLGRRHVSKASKAMQECDDNLHPVLFDTKGACDLPRVGSRFVNEYEGWGISRRDAQFVRVWNGLLDRSTTQEEDLHGILANTLDFGAGEILKLNHDDRMRAMLVAQERIPLEIFCNEISRQRGDGDPRHRWIPRFPDGPRILGAKWARVVEGGFVLDSRHGPLGFLVPYPEQAQALGSFCLVTTPELFWGQRRHFRVKLANPLETDLREPRELFVFLNHHLPDGGTHPLLVDSLHNGACFYVSHRDGLLIKVRFACSLSFVSCWDTAGPEALAHDGVPVLEGAHLTIDHEVFIDAGKQLHSLQTLRRTKKVTFLKLIRHARLEKTQLSPPNIWSTSRLYPRGNTQI